MASRDLHVRIIGDAKSLERAFARSSKASRQFDREMTGSLGRVNAAFTGLDRLRTGALFGGVAAAAGVAGLKEAVGIASDLGEALSKNRQIFGAAAAEIDDWSRTTARSIGIARDQALTATGTFGALLNTVGLAPEKAAAMSRALVQLAGDLGSFSNASPEEALDALRSGLIGEAEPLRRFGVLLSEARVQQVAMAQSGKTAVKSLTDQEKALARYAIILKDTKPAAGDFARTQGSLAQQSKVMKAELRDLGATIGREFLPPLSRATGGVNALAGALFGAKGAAADLAAQLDDPAFRRKIADVFGQGALTAALTGVSTIPARPDEGLAAAVAASNRSTERAKANSRRVVETLLGAVEAVTDTVVEGSKDAEAALRRGQAAERLRQTF
jgi:hypothetical protein